MYLQPLSVQHIPALESTAWARPPVCARQEFTKRSGNIVERSSSIRQDWMNDVPELYSPRILYGVGRSGTHSNISDDRFLTYEFCIRRYRRRFTACWSLALSIASFPTVSSSTCRASPDAKEIQCGVTYVHTHRQCSVHICTHMLVGISRAPPPHIHKALCC